MAASDNQINIRKPRKSELNRIHNICLDEGWHETLAGFEVGYDLNPDGWRVAETQEGEIIGVCAATIVNDVVGVMGPYIVDRTHRGRGIGTRLWKESHATLGTRNTYLFATIPEVYKRIGFQEYPYDFRIMSGVPHADNRPTIEGTIITKAQNVPTEHIVKYDTSVNCGIPRPQFVQKRIMQKKATTLIAYKEHQSGITVTGYGAVRPVNTGWQLAPLYADDPSIAEALLLELVREIPKDTKVYAFLLTANTVALDLACTIGLTIDGHQKPMYFKEMTKLPTDRIYTLSTGVFVLV